MIVNKDNVPNSSYCFITTATCLALGEKKDCRQLNILRSFRDEYICTDEEGQSLVKEYYRIGPGLVKKD